MVLLEILPSIKESTKGIGRRPPPLRMARFLIKPFNIPLPLPYRIPYKIPYRVPYKIPCIISNICIYIYIYILRAHR